MKLLKTHITEKFAEDSDPIYDLGIGRKTLIERWLNQMRIEKYVINDDFTIDALGPVDLCSENIGEFPEYIQFNHVQGHFRCTLCDLISLRGSPKKVDHYFSCKYNKLTSLEYAPLFINMTLFCEGNDIPEQEIIDYINRAKAVNKQGISVSYNYKNYHSWK